MDLGGDYYDVVVSLPSKQGLLDDISAYVDSIADQLWPVNRAIHDHPELGYK